VHGSVRLLQGSKEKHQPGIPWIADWDILFPGGQSNDSVIGSAVQEIKGEGDLYSAKY
jgi:hypothetical protein